MRTGKASPLAFLLCRENDDMYTCNTDHYSFAAAEEVGFFWKQKGIQDNSSRVIVILLYCTINSQCSELGQDQGQDQGKGKGTVQYEHMGWGGGYE